MSAPLLIEHFLDTTAYGIYHVEIYHSPTQAFITEMRLRLFVPQNILQSSRNVFRDSETTMNNKN